MTEMPLIPDASMAAGAIPPIAPIAPIAGVGGAAAPSADAQLFTGLVDAAQSAGTSLQSAQSAEHAFATGQGDLQTMVFERARADSMLEVASATASKVTSALQSIMNMQV